MFSFFFQLALNTCVSYLNQKTINSSITFEGIGLHSGKNVKICIKSAEPNTGIIFKRVDLKINNTVYPNFSNVTNTSLNTTISNEFGVKVSTIEHLMGALFGLGIDNALIEINNEEVPILDGSAKVFIEKFLNVGFKVSSAPIKIIKINKRINDLSKENKSKAIVNLASVEYFSVLKKDQINLPVINPVFKDYKNGNYKIISFFAKKARGTMARFIIQNKIKKPEDLMSFDLDGYRYSKKESKENSPVFLRKS